VVTRISRSPRHESRTVSMRLIAQFRYNSNPLGRRGFSVEKAITPTVRHVSERATELARVAHRELSRPEAACNLDKHRHDGLLAQREYLATVWSACVSREPRTH